MRCAHDGRLQSAPTVQAAYLRFSMIILMTEILFHALRA